MRNTKQKIFTSLKHRMFNFIDKINENVKVKLKDFDIGKKREFCQ